MPTSTPSRLLAWGYLVAVIASALVWVIQGPAFPAAVLATVVLTLPFSLLAYVVLLTAGMALVWSPVGTVVVPALILLLFPGVALANVVMTRAAWEACRRLRRMPARTSGPC